MKLENPESKATEPQSEHEKRIVAARARLTAATAAQYRSREQEQEREVQELERRAAEAEELAKIAAKLGPRGENWDVIETPFGAIALESPDSVDYQAWADAKNNTTEAALAALSRPCVRYPSLVKLDQILQAKPGINGRLANLALRLAGFKADDQQGK